MGGLYKGLVPSVWLVSHGSIQLTAYEWLKEMWARGRERNPRDWKPIVNPTEAGALGLASKFIAVSTTYPIQVVRARMQQRADVYRGEDAPCRSGGTSLRANHSSRRRSRAVQRVRPERSSRVTELGHHLCRVRGRVRVPHRSVPAPTVSYSSSSHSFIPRDPSTRRRARHVVDERRRSQTPAPRASELMFAPGRSRARRASIIDSRRIALGAVIAAQTRAVARRHRARAWGARKGRHQTARVIVTLRRHARDGDGIV